MYVRKIPKRFFIGGFTNEINEDKIYRYVNRRGLKVTKVKLFPSRRSADDVIIQLNVEDNMQCELLEQKGFWPRDIICKPWMTRSELTNVHFNLEVAPRFKRQQSNTSRSFENMYNRYRNLD